MRVRGYHPGKFCILVTTCCEISCFLKTTAKKLVDQYIVGPPTYKLGDQSPPVPTVVAPMDDNDDDDDDDGTQYNREQF